MFKFLWIVIFLSNFFCVDIVSMDEKKSTNLNTQIEEKSRQEVLTDRLSSEVLVDPKVKKQELIQAMKTSLDEWVETERKFPLIASDSEGRLKQVDILNNLNNTRDKFLLAKYASVELQQKGLKVLKKIKRYDCLYHDCPKCFCFIVKCPVICPIGICMCLCNLNMADDFLGKHLVDGDKTYEREYQNAFKAIRLMEVESMVMERD